MKLPPKIQVRDAGIGPLQLLNAIDFLMRRGDGDKSFGSFVHLVEYARSVGWVEPPQ